MWYCMVIALWVSILFTDTELLSGPGTSNDKGIGHLTGRGVVRPGMNSIPQKIKLL